MKLFLTIICALFLLSACTASDPFSERARLKPIREAAQAGDAVALAKLEAEAKRGVPEAGNQMGNYYFQKFSNATKNDDYESIFKSEKYNDYLTALKWWEDAAVRGNAPAAYNLGLEYEGHSYFPVQIPEAKAHVEAAKWYRMAAERGDRASRYTLWDFFFRDTVNATAGHTIDFHAVSAEEAPKWLRLAAEQGEPKAQWWLATLYRGGNAKIKLPNAEESYFWKKVLTTYNPEFASRAFHLPADTEYALSPQQIENIERKAKNWKPAPVPWPQPPTKQSP